MSDQPCLPVDREYTSALGVAVYAWATLEWIAVRCCERIRPGSIQTLSDRTAGRVADTLNALVRDMAASPEQHELGAAAARSRALVRTRNNLLHAKPGINAAGRQRLFRSGDEWALEELAQIANAFTDCGMKLERFLDGYASELVP